MGAVVDQLIKDEPRFHSGGDTNWNALPEILLTLESLVGPETVSIETGCGASTVVFASGGGRHTTISPDPREHDLVRAYCDKTGIDHSNVTFVANSSDQVLPAMAPGRTLDVAFIDGAHGFPFAILDWHFINERLKVGGHILVDDVAIPAIAPVFRFMRSEDWWSLVGIPDDRAGLFRLAVEPPPEDYTLQKFNRHLDYSFAPPAVRARLTASALAGKTRRAVGKRMPWLRDAYHRVR